MYEKKQNTLSYPYLLNKDPKTLLGRKHTHPQISTLKLLVSFTSLEITKSEKGIKDKS